MKSRYFIALAILFPLTLGILPAQAAKIGLDSSTCLKSLGNANRVGTPVTLGSCEAPAYSPAEVQVSWVISWGDISLSKCIGFAGGKAVAGAVAVMVECGHARNGPWTLMDNGYFKHGPSGLCLTASRAANGALLRPCGSDDANQDWDIH